MLMGIPSCAHLSKRRSMRGSSGCGPMTGLAVPARAPRPAGPTDPKPLPLTLISPTPRPPQTMALFERFDRAGPESRLRNAGEVEAAPQVETPGVFGVRLAHFIEPLGCCRPGEDHRLLHVDRVHELHHLVNLLRRAGTVAMRVDDRVLGPFDIGLGDFVNGHRTVIFQQQLVGGDVPHQGARLRGLPGGSPSGSGCRPGKLHPLPSVHTWYSSISTRVSQLRYCQMILRCAQLCSDRGSRPSSNRGPKRSGYDLGRGPAASRHTAR